MVIELATITVMVRGTVAGGDGLLPGSVFHVPPQAGGFVLVTLPNPLNAAGAGPPLSEFCLAHCAPQNVTCRPTIALLSPMTKLPPRVGAVAAGVGVGVGVDVRLGVAVGVGVRLGVGVGVEVGVRVGVRVGVGVPVGVGVGVEVGVVVGVAVGVGVGVGVGLGVRVGVGAGGEVGVGGVGVGSMGVGVGVGDADVVPVTSTHAENSDVLPLGSVAVAVMN